MVTLCFKLTDTAPVTVELSQPAPLSEVLDMCRARLGEEFGSVIAFRQGKKLPPTGLVDPGDTVDLYPAISGG